MMRTSVVIPDRLARRMKAQVGQGSTSEFVREAIQHRLDDLERRALVREMEAGYVAESQAPSLEPEWDSIEVEGW